uniref:RING-type domain-containing protein n=1 Tax=Oryzias latipes TaxID=8090 RepID=A0A3B3I494_ORYLA
MYVVQCRIFFFNFTLFFFYFGLVRLKLNVSVVFLCIVMALNTSLMAEESFLCSICLELFNQPTSIPCGHTFCLQCITDYWDTSTALLLCPPKQSFTPDQCRNKVLKNSWTIAGSESVLCNLCSEPKVTAVKSCLGCFMFFCQTHLEPHQSNVVLRKHKFMPPVKNLESRICKTHGEPLEVSPINHVILTLEEEAQKDFRLTEKKNQKTHPHIVRSYLQRKRRHAVDVTLQRDAVHPFLAVFDDWKQDYDAYHYRYNVSAKEEFFSGKFYYEVKVKGKTQWYLGVAKESINRSGDIRLRLGVFVGYEEGQVTFYNVGEMDCIFSFTGCAFTEKLFPFFSPCGND